MTPADQQRRAVLERELGEASAAISRVPSLPQVWVGRFEQPKETVHVMKGGDPQKKGAEVRPASLSTLAQVTPGFALAADAPESERRLALAQWLVREDNPLTARVLANRLWHYHFGTGIVDTPSDFGKLGGLPTHPELLDWLARRVQHHGWKLKAMHREILLSQAYQQSAKWREEASKIDADSRLLWRFPPRRFSAEEIRDTLLSVAGVLDPRAGGPGFKLYRYLQDNVATYLPLDRHGPETYRRAVYHHNARASVVDLMTEFDMPDCAFATPRRAATTSPLQALTLLNHRFTLDMAEALARRVTKETGADDHAAQVQRALVLAFGRPTTAGEIKEGVKFVQRQSLAAYCRALLNANELIHVE